LGFTSPDPRWWQWWWEAEADIDDINPDDVIDGQARWDSHPPIEGVAVVVGGGSIKPDDVGGGGIHIP